MELCSKRVSDITYKSEFTRHEAWRVQFARMTYVNARLRNSVSHALIENETKDC